MYPAPAVTGITPGSLGDHLCGPHRPGHFAGVLLVVAKLFHIVEPDVAVFGRKDAQQARLIAQMVTDLHFPVTIDVLPTVREPDGLAMSSRNAYLSADDRRRAAAIPRALAAAHAVHAAGERRAATIVAAAAEILARTDGLRPQYTELVDAGTLAPVTHAGDTALLAIAAHVGPTRLIDNIVIGKGLDGDITLDA
jgi:pantoate--beta-alanine ligase